MTWQEKKQIRLMRWILFFIFVSLFVINAILTILAVYFKLHILGLGEHENLLVKIFVVQTGIMVLTLFKSIFSLKKRPVEIETKPIPNVNGKYKYEATWSENNTVHSGQCQIKQDGNNISVQGERTKECNGRKSKRVSIHWSSNWAELCNDEKLRFDYSITENGGGRGYAILELGKRTSKTMLGEIHLFKGDSLFGTLKFRKIYKSRSSRR